jgi:hypothetical protein
MIIITTIRQVLKLLGRESFQFVKEGLVPSTSVYSVRHNLHHMHNE